MRHTEFLITAENPGWFSGAPSKRRASHRRCGVCYTGHHRVVGHSRHSSRAACSLGRVGSTTDVGPFQNDSFKAWLRFHRSCELPGVDNAASLGGTNAIFGAIIITRFAIQARESMFIKGDAQWKGIRILTENS